MITFSEFSLVVGAIATILGLITGMITIFQTYNKILESFNQLKLTDEIFDAKIESLKKNIERIDDDMRQERSERTNITRNIYEKMDNLEEKLNESNTSLRLLIKDKLTNEEDVNDL